MTTSTVISARFPDPGSFLPGIGAIGSGIGCWDIGG